MHKSCRFTGRGLSIPATPTVRTLAPALRPLPTLATLAGLFLTQLALADLFGPLARRLDPLGHPRPLLLVELLHRPAGRRHRAGRALAQLRQTADRLATLGRHVPHRLGLAHHPLSTLFAPFAHPSAVTLARRTAPTLALTPPHRALRHREHRADHPLDPFRPQPILIEQLDRPIEPALDQKLADLRPVLLVVRDDLGTVLGLDLPDRFGLFLAQGEALGRPVGGEHADRPHRGRHGQTLLRPLNHLGPALGTHHIALTGLTLSGLLLHLRPAEDRTLRLGRESKARKRDDRRGRRETESKTDPVARNLAAVPHDAVPSVAARPSGVVLFVGRPPKAEGRPADCSALPNAHASGGIAAGG